MAWKETAAATLLLALAATGAHAQQGTGSPWGHGHWDGPWHGWFLGPLMMLVFVALAAVVVVLIVRWMGTSAGSREPSHEGSRPNTPLDILKERFARGEIEQADFEERRKALED